MRIHVELVGREGDLAEAKARMDALGKGEGSTLLISGEPGIGKTRFTEELERHAERKGAKVLRGAADADSLQPFLAFSSALKGETDEPLFLEEEFVSFSEVFAVNRAGLLVAQARPEGGEGLDADIFAGMLSAVQDFVRDSFSGAGGERAGIGRLEYGDMSILVEHGELLYVTAVLKGAEHPDMRAMLARSVKEIEKSHGSILRSWAGSMGEVKALQSEIEKLSSAKFLVRKVMEGVKLDTERLRISDKVFERLASMSREKPVLLVLEDMHWADVSSLFVLTYLARNIGRERIMLACTYRPEEGQTLKNAVDKLRQEGAVFEIALKKLAHADVFKIINNIYKPNDFSSEFVGEVASKCGGNPLFVVELLSQLGASGGIKRQKGTYVLLAKDYEIPGTVQEVVQRSLGFLEHDALALAEYASCIGREFDAGVAMSMTSMKDPRAALAKLEDSGLIVASGGRMSFVHALFQETLYGNVSPRWRSAYHRSIGEYYEKANVGKLDEVMFELATHFSRTSEHAKAFGYCVEAGMKAEASFAAEQAIKFYGDALAAFPKLRAESMASGANAEVLERLGDMLVMIGDFEKAITNYEKLAGGAGDAGVKARALRKIAEAYDNIAEYDKSLAYCELARSALGDKESLENARISVAEGVVHWRRGDAEKAMARMKSALPVFEKLGIAKDTGNTLRQMGNIYLMKGEYDDAYEQYARSAEMLEKAGDLYGLSATLGNQGMVFMFRGDIDTALECCEKCLAMEKKIGDKCGIAMTLNNMGTIFYDKGDLDKALEYYEKGLAESMKIGDMYNVAGAIDNMGNAYHNKGELAKSIEYHLRSLSIHESMGDRSGMATCIGNLAAVYTDSGEFEKALENYDRGLVIEEEIGDKHGSIHYYTGMAEANLSMGNVQKALEQARRGLEISLDIGASIEEGLARRILGMAHMQDKDLEGALDEFGRAKAILDSGIRNDELARLHYEYGQIFGKMGEPDREKEHMEKAMSLFEKMGMKLWTEKCRKALNNPKN